MSTRSNNLVNPNAREAMNRFKMEAAGEVGVNLKQGYNGDLTSTPGRLRRRPDGQEDDRGLRERHEVSESFKSEKPPITGGFLRLYGQRYKCCGTCLGVDAERRPPSNSKSVLISRREYLQRSENRSRSRRKPRVSDR